MNITATLTDPGNKQPHKSDAKQKSHRRADHNNVPQGRPCMRKSFCVQAFRTTDALITKQPTTADCEIMPGPESLAAH